MQSSGDAMLDVYLLGEVERISPEAPVPVVRVRARKLALGGAANVANNIVTIGAKCELVSAIGDDLQVATLRQMLREGENDSRSLSNVDSPPRTRPGRGTTQKVVRTTRRKIESQGKKKPVVKP